MRIERIETALKEEKAEPITIDVRTVLNHSPTVEPPTPVDLMNDINLTHIDMSRSELEELETNREELEMSREEMREMWFNSERLVNAPGEENKGMEEYIKRTKRLEEEFEKEYERIAKAYDYQILFAVSYHLLETSLISCCQHLNCESSLYIIIE